jgi:hypothetical protein
MIDLTDDAGIARRLADLECQLREARQEQRALVEMLKERLDALAALLSRDYPV